MVPGARLHKGEPAVFTLTLNLALTLTPTLILTINLTLTLALTLTLTLTCLPAQPARPMRVRAAVSSVMWFHVLL